MPETHAARGDRRRCRAARRAGRRARREPRRAAPRASATAPERAPRADGGEQIGVTGERLTRDEAFDLVRRAVESLVTGDEAVRASVVRAKARELLGRDSESLSDRNFPRILKDAHDDDVIDLRRRGDDFEIARAAEAESVSDQLAKTAIANAPAPAAAPPVPRGMGARGVSGPRGRGGRPGAPPADLLSIGVVRSAATLAPPPAAPAAVADAAPPAAAAPAVGSRAAGARRRPSRAPSAPRRRRPERRSDERRRASRRVADVIAPAAKKAAAKKPRAKKVATATSKG